VKIKILKCTNGAGSKHMKLKIYTTVIKPIMPYGCEMWTMTEGGKEKKKKRKKKSSLKTWGHKLLKKNIWPNKRSQWLENLNKWCTADYV
jgi:hypothetical protein